MHFNQIGNKPNNANQPQYSFVDNNPLALNYYKLKLPNGKYSPVIRILLSKPIEPTFMQTGNMLTISNMIAGSTILVYTTDGRLLLKKISSYSSETLNVPTGLSFIEIISLSGEVTTKKVIY